MKNSFLIYILACMTSLFTFTSCEENADQVIKAQPDTKKEITTRTIEDCDDCPEEDCCCVIENLSGNNIDLLFCGVSTMTLGSACGPVSPGSPCGTISGVSYLLSLTPFGRGYFCVGDGDSFSILKTVGPSSNVRVNCKAEEIIPPWMGFTIGASPVYFYVEECGLTGC